MEKEGAVALGESYRRLPGSKWGDFPRQILTEVSPKRIIRNIVFCSPIGGLSQTPSVFQGRKSGSIEASKDEDVRARNRESAERDQEVCAS